MFIFHCGKWWNLFLTHVPSSSGHEPQLDSGQIYVLGVRTVEKHTIMFVIPPLVRHVRAAIVFPPIATDTIHHQHAAAE